LYNKNSNLIFLLTVAGELCPQPTQAIARRAISG
jgi:hypothetical protein